MSTLPYGQLHREVIIEVMDTHLDTHCSLAWIHVAANTSGQVRLCCNSLPGLNLVRDGQLTFSLANSGDLDRAINAPSQRALRLEMLSGQRPAACGRCFREEDAGLRSPRSTWNEQYPLSLDELRKVTGELGHTDVPIRYLDLRLGNLCNLKCRMCNPYSSRKWLEDWNEIEPELDAEAHHRLSHLDWFETESFWTNIKPHLETIDQIYFTGGEPMLSKAHLKILDHLVTNGRAQEIILKYNTNLTLLPPIVLAFWPHFKRVKVNCSLDGIGELNSYIRHPAKWSEVNENLLILNSLAEKNQNIELETHVTVQALNIMGLTAILDHMSTLPSFRPLPYLNILNHPHWANVRVLPYNLKQKACAQISHWLKYHPKDRFPHHQSAWNRLNDLPKYVLTDDMSSTHFAEFKHKTLTLDRVRNESLEQVAPELFGAFSV